MSNKLTKQQVKDELWRRGELGWKCHKVQLEMRDIYYKSEGNTTHVWLLSRQTGKSYLISLIAIEQALRTSNAVVKILTDTKIHVEKIIVPIFNELLQDCPEDVKPEYLKSDFTYTFKNGSQIQFAGTDGGHYERLRGQKSTAVFVDEAGFCRDLMDVVKSVLLPTTTHTGGRIILASTPSSDPEHDFNEFIEEAELNGTLVKKTIHDNPLLTKPQIERIIREMGGETSPKFRREYLCEIIRDESKTVFPEFDEELQNRLVKEWIKPTHYEGYVAMDLGYKDLTVVLFGYFDFMKDVVVIEDEIIKTGKDLRLDIFTQEILDKESYLWTDLITNEKKKVRSRVSDINYLVTQEIHRYSSGQLTFLPPRKDDKIAAINQVRTALKNEKIIISPKCQTLIRHLKNCKWRQGSKVEFARSVDDGHYDAADALLYLFRSINFASNPYPKDYSNFYHTFNYRDTPGSKTIDVFKSIFGPKVGKR